MNNRDIRDMLFERMARDEEYLRACAASGERPSALMFYGKVTGIAETMEACELISSESKDRIIKRAWDEYMGRAV